MVGRIATVVRRRNVSAALIPPILSLLLLAAGSGCGRDAPFRGHHVVLINIETLRADCCGAYGAELGWTPEIDSLAARGILVERAYTVAPWTRPSVASLWTGLYPSQHGVKRMDPDHRLPEKAVTLAERFAGAGYRTFGAVTNANLSPELGFAQGFEEYLYRIGARADTLAAWTLDWVDRQIAGLEEGKKGPPLFIALHFDEPHGAFFQTAFRSGVDGKSREEMIRRVESLEEGERIAALEAYGARVAAVDKAIGELVRDLRARLGSDWLLVLTADHGEEWFDHGGLFHGFTLYEELIRVPLLFVSPGLAPSKRPGPMRNVDVLPTLSAWTGLREDGPNGGGSALGRALLGHGLFPEDVFAETDYERALVSRIGKREKYISDINNNWVEIYDVNCDLGERRNLAEEGRGGEGEHAAAVEAWRANLAAGTIAPEDGEPSLDARKRSELEEELRAIGYLGAKGRERGTPWPAGNRLDWRGLYRRFRVLRAGDPEISFDGGEWKTGAFPPRRVGWADASITVKASFRNGWALLGSHPWSGIAEIEVDGRIVEKIDLFSPQEGDRQKVLSIRLADAGPHTVHIRATGEKSGGSRASELLFDGFAIERVDGVGR
ncbi:MAG: sulfatase [Candidatus Eisenbacteria bacterium]|nr:sulfatase [Candidatus Eisenbacteria bacterium]